MCIHIYIYIYIRIYIYIYIYIYIIVLSIYCIYLDPADAQLHELGDLRGRSFTRQKRTGMMGNQRGVCAHLPTNIIPTKTR